MGVVARDIPITRDQVYAWIEEAKQQKKGKAAYIRQQVNALGLDDPQLDVSQRDDFKGDEVHIADVIIADLGSYT
jgi:hypothetical protein